MDPFMIIIMALLLVAFIALNSWSKKSQQKRQAEHERLMKEQLVPGAWVHTRVGFFGRFVDLDGDVLILETPSGEETYWNKAVIVSVGDLPFADQDGELEPESSDDSDNEIESADVVEVDEIDASVPDDARELTGEELSGEELAGDDETPSEGDTKN